jgi:hypothetical protein
MLVIPFLALAVFLLTMASNAGTHNVAVRMSRIDHLVYATPDLDAGVERVERLLGVRAIPGGQHPGAGTRNALIGLGDQVYLEIIGPDPDQPKPPRARRFGIDELESPRLVTWAAKGSDLDRLVAESRRQGLDLGQVQAGSRKRPDGVMLAWKLTVSRTLTEGGVVPFLIDWGATAHPASALPRGCTLVDLRAEHPNPERVQAMITALGLELPVTRGSAPALIATIATPRGVVELR